MKNKKVLWAILAVIVIAAAWIIIAKPFTPKGDGSITVKVTDLDQKLIKEKKIVFNTGDKLVDLLKNNFDNVLFDNGMIMNIESLVTPADWAQYIAIWINGEFAGSHKGGYLSFFFDTFSHLEPVILQYKHFQFRVTIINIFRLGHVIYHMNV